MDLCNGVEDIMTNSQLRTLPPSLMHDIQHTQPFPRPRITGPGLVIYAAA